MLNDPLANTLSKIMNAEKLGKKTVEISPASKVIKEVLRIMKENQFIGDFEEFENGRGNIIEINLLGFKSLTVTFGISREINTSANQYLESYKASLSIGLFISFLYFAAKL